MKRVHQPTTGCCPSFRSATPKHLHASPVVQLSAIPTPEHACFRGILVAPLRSPSRILFLSSQTKPTCTAGTKFPARVDFQAMQSCLRHADGAKFRLNQGRDWTDRQEILHTTSFTWCTLNQFQKGIGEFDFALGP